MLREAQGPAGGILETIPLDGSSALRMLTLGRHPRSPSALPVSKNAKMLPRADNMADTARTCAALTWVSKQDTGAP